MMSYLLWPSALALGWLGVYIFWIKPLRAKLVAVVPSIVEAQPTSVSVVGMTLLPFPILEPPTAWQKFVAKVEGWKTIGLSLALSIFATSSSIFDVIAHDTSVLDDVQAMPWASFLKPDVALKITSALLAIIPIFHMVGKVKAAMAPPVGTGAERADA